MLKRNRFLFVFAFSSFILLFSFSASALPVSYSLAGKVGVFSNGLYQSQEDISGTLNIEFNECHLSDKYYVNYNYSFSMNFNSDISNQIISNGLLQYEYDDQTMKYTCNSAFENNYWGLFSIRFLGNEVDHYNQFANSGYMTDSLNMSGDKLFFNSSGQCGIYLDSVSGSRNYPEPVPEPSTMILLGTGILGLFGVHKKTRRDKF
jgi:hypothetical protein